MSSVAVLEAVIRVKSM